MNIGLIDVDGHSKFPNIPLMKLARWHKNRGDNVEFYSVFGNYDIVSHICVQWADALIEELKKESK